MPFESAPLEASLSTIHLLYLGRFLKNYSDQNNWGVTLTSTKQHKLTT